MAKTGPIAMRQATVWLALILTIGLLALPASTSSASDWPANSYVLRVEGLACPYCGYGIEKQFAKQEGVAGTTIEIDDAVVVVEVTESTRFSDDELERLVDDAGFELGRIVHRPAEQ